MNDDFNAPVLVANLFEAVKFINAVNDNKETISGADLKLLVKEMHDFVFDVLGLKPATEENNQAFEKIMELVLEIRQDARNNKDWDTSDKIRDYLSEAGIKVKDNKEGAAWQIE
jgi:cysteinyl-tRNA synthetase (EC 6.1.1.16)